MTLLSPAHAVTVPFRRPTLGGTGPAKTVTWTDQGPTTAVVSLTGATGDPVLVQAGIVFLPRALDRKAGDRFTYHGMSYVLTGGRRGDHDHPFTGDDFGWIAHAFSQSGGHTVTFISDTPGEADPNGIRSPGPNPVDIADCLMRRVSAAEQSAATEIATEVWECLAPPHTESVRASPSGQLVHLGDTYHVIARAQLVTELSGGLHHVKVLCRKHLA